MSLSSTYLSRKQLIADNLNSMGVDSADVNDGLTTLANRILDIEPSISGLELDTRLVLHASDDTVLVGQSVMFWAELRADYDDETLVDVDLSGVLTGATVVFKEGNTVLGSAVTDSDGIAYYTHTFDSVGEYSVVAGFAGTDNFDSCVSSIVTVNVNYILSISSDKSILNYNDGDIANITCNVSDLDGGVSGETVYYQILHDDTVLDSGSDVTDNNGDISIEYVSSGIGDVSVIFSLRSILQKTYKIYDGDIRFETQDITMESHDGTRFIANVYENGELVTKTDIDYSIGEATYTGTLLFTILQTGLSYCRLFNNNIPGVALNLNFMQVGEYDIITTYKTHDKEFTVTNHISIS